MDFVQQHFFFNNIKILFVKLNFLYRQMLGTIFIVSNRSKFELQIMNVMKKKNDYQIFKWAINLAIFTFKLSAQVSVNISYILCLSSNWGLYCINSALTVNVQHATLVLIQAVPLFANICNCTKCNLLKMEWRLSKECVRGSISMLLPNHFLNREFVRHILWRWTVVPHLTHLRTFLVGWKVPQLFLSQICDERFRLLN